jgi:CRP-like cAMP-binding protein
MLDSFRVRENQILAELPESELNRLLPSFENVTMAEHEVLYGCGDAIQHLYFPLDTAISLVSDMADGKRVEVGLVGNEGVVGWGGLLLDACDGIDHAVVVIPGNCIRARIESIREEFERCSALHYCLLRFQTHHLRQVQQTAACNRLHPLMKRLVRWLLMLDERVRRNELTLTHEFLAEMLGSPRSEVTFAAGQLRKAGLIEYERGEIRILDRNGLEAITCECYKVCKFKKPAEKLLKVAARNGHNGSRRD